MYLSITHVADCHVLFPSSFLIPPACLLACFPLTALLWFYLSYSIQILAPSLTKHRCQPCWTSSGCTTRASLQTGAEDELKMKHVLPWGRLGQTSSGWEGYCSASRHAPGSLWLYMAYKPSVYECEYMRNVHCLRRLVKARLLVIPWQLTQNFISNWQGDDDV